MIEYRDSLEGVTAERLGGFFVGWPSPPSPEVLLRILKASHAAVIAVDGGSGNVVGFINAISDGILSAYIPLLEVLPSFQGQGVGSQLTSRMVDRLKGLYMVDVVCDSHLEGFYRRAGFSPSLGMVRRNYGSQSGRRDT